MKRESNTYDKIWQWETLIEAEVITTNGKLKKRDVIKHKKNRIKNLTDIQTKLVENRMKTSEYKYMKRRSASGKMRDISYVQFNPNQIYHQATVIAGNERVEKHLIYDTYASRVDKGQIAGALRVKQWLVENPKETVWFGKGDIKKYFDTMPHKLIRESLEKVFKCKRYVDTVLEPIEKFGSKGTPLGIRPSQINGNLLLSEFDHWAKEVMKMKYYIRYMDDFVVLCKTKGEAKYFMNAAEKKLTEMGLKAHTPKIHRVSNGLSYLGFMFYADGEMFWRRKNKAAWLKRRDGITNAKRLQEIDAAAWGALKHGNKHCKKLFKLKTGMTLKELGIQKRNSIVGKDGKRFFDEPRINTAMVINETIDIVDWEKGITTRQGEDRWVLLVKFHDKRYRLIINSLRLKNFIEMLEEKNVTAFRSKIIDRAGNKHYDFDFDNTTVLTINGESTN